MAVDPSVRIDIAAEFVGKKAFKQADTATDKLTKGVKKLAGTLGIAFGTKAILNFGKSAAKAFIEDENAARSLGITIKNLGLNYDNNAITVGRFIDNLEQQTGVLDDQLRPAMDRLLRATGSVTKSQELLNLSLDIAAGTGKSVEQVSQSLQKAYLGQTAAIGRLGVGISKAELATGDFVDIQNKLTKLFAGQAASAANSYAGQLAKLQVAANNAKETIGEGLIDALKLLGDDTSIDQLNSGLETTALYIADIIRGVGVFVQKLKDIPVAGAAFQLPLDAYIQAIPVIGTYISVLADLGAEVRRLGGKAGRAFTGGSGGPSRDFADEKAAKALAAAEKKRLAAEIAAAKAREAAAKRAEKSEKARAALSKAAAQFDLNKIQIAAALKATYDKDERLRLLAMQEIENDNGEKALDYIKQLKLLTDEQQTNKLAGITAISQTELNSINKILLDELARISSTKMTQEQADEARAEAYRKYNAAIIASGGLAEANFYTEKTQTDLLKIARLAALHEVGTAQATLDILNYTTQTDIIARIAAAQALADAQKLQALRQYLAEQAGGNRSIYTPGMSPEQIADAATAAAAAAAAAAESAAAALEESLSRFPRFSGGLESIAPGYGSFNDYFPPMGDETMGQFSNSITVIVEGNVLDGDDFTDKVNNALLDSIRKGRTQFPAGSVPG